MWFRSRLQDHDTSDQNKYKDYILNETSDPPPLFQGQSWIRLNFDKGLGHFRSKSWGSVLFTEKRWVLITTWWNDGNSREGEELWFGIKQLSWIFMIEISARVLLLSENTRQTQPVRWDYELGKSQLCVLYMRARHMLEILIIGLF